MMKPIALLAVFGAILAAAPAGATATEPFRLTLRSPLLALAQDDVLADDDEGGGEGEEGDGDPADDTTAPPAGGEVKVGGEKGAEAVGGAVGFVRETGFYTTSDLGGHIRFGGWADGENGFRSQQRITSNLQPYIGLAIGYDIFDFLALQLSFGTGFVANAAPVQGQVDSPRDFGITFMNLAAIGTLWIDRFGLVLKLFGGGALLQPPPMPADFPLGGNAGAGIGVRWATLLPGVTIGAEVNGYGVFAQSAGGFVIIPGLSFAPTIKYVF